MTEDERDELIRRMADDMSAIRRALEQPRQVQWDQRDRPESPHARPVAGL